MKFKLVTDLMQDVIRNVTHLPSSEQNKFASFAIWKKKTYVHK